MDRQHCKTFNKAAGFLLASSFVFLSGCTAVRVDGKINSRLDPDRVEVKMSNNDLKKAVQSPLYDLNLKRDKIPPLLINMTDVYAHPQNCRMARREVNRLSQILGPDPATLVINKRDKVVLKPANALGSTLSSYLPYGSLIRTLSGANTYQKKHATAILRGQLRRSFLYGWQHNARCDSPPLPQTTSPRQQTNPSGISSTNDAKGLI